MPHLIDFKGRNHSGPVNQNLLWQDGNVYLMDNHRAALWCWQQELDLYRAPHCILHIDRHPDCLGADLNTHMAQMPDLRGLSIDDYLGAELVRGNNTAFLFRWDNYLSIHIEAFRKNLRGLISADFRDGDDPNFASAMRPRPDQLPQNLAFWLSKSEAPWIVNIDLDYFFCDGPIEEGRDEEWLPLFSNEFFDAVMGQIKQALDAGHAKVVTLCLTPSNYTSGWERCLQMSRQAFDILGREHPKV